jgi:hypothetical protein
MKRFCNCKDWKENIGYIDGMVTMSVIHGSKGYEGKKFIFCPWCSKKLEEE